MSQIFKSKWMIITGILLCLGVLTFIIIGQRLASPNRTLEKFNTAITGGHVKQLQEILISGDKKVEINDEASKALIKHFKENKTVYKKVQNQLKQDIEKENNDSSRLLSLSPSGKTMLFFTQYKVKVQPQMITVSGKRDNEKVELEINNQVIPETGKSQTYGPVFPGSYQVKKKVINELGIFIKNEKISVWDKENSVTVDSKTWIQDDPNIQKNIVQTVHQFNQEVSLWETSEYDPAKLTSATSNVQEYQTSLRKPEFNTVKKYISEIQSAYLGMVVDMDSIDIWYSGDRWNASLDVLVSYKYGIKLKGKQQFKDLSYKRGQQIHLIFDKEAKKWLINGLDNNYVTESTVDTWDHKEDVKVSTPKVQTWHSGGATNL
ncbi:hypothetical protein GMB86_05125 [Terrilactibacillus sp. BCM23-1]|uniref:Uncharacterized protein n=1 Tax=Terrilactibacillus tamarindi TaxID=2599694 RepID=A0A6N8CN83_9BACI|nr:hypothetical protein [Terrilactibacillus tamarindi]MTT31401.1 hypothetical protein [Terrilactibacillus tamarindi]